MKKFLLMAVAAIMAVSANAQSSGKTMQTRCKRNIPTAAIQKQTFKVMPARNAAYSIVGRSNYGKQFKADVKSFRNVTNDVKTFSLDKKLTFDPSLLNTAFAAKAPHKTPEDMKDAYKGNGYSLNRSTYTWDAVSEWDVIPDTMHYSTKIYDCIDDILPPDMFSSAVKYLYYTDTVNGDTLYMSYGPFTSYSTYMIYALDYTDFKAGGSGIIKLVAGTDGSLKLANPNNTFGWYACSYNSSTYAPTAIAGAYAQYAGITYTTGADDPFVATQSYTGKGKDQEESAVVSWTMILGKNGDTDVVRDIVPSIKAGHMDVTATVNGETITIEPQKVGEVTSSGSTYYLYLAGETAADGSITLTRNSKTGYITVPDGEGVCIGVFSTDAFDPEYGDTYKGYYQITQNVKYYAEGQEIPEDAPEVFSDASGSGLLYAGLSTSGYRFTTVNLAMAPAYADMVCKNYTSDEATAWEWSAKKVEYNSASGEFETLETRTGTDKDYTLSTGAYETWNDITLKGWNGENVSEPDTVGHKNTYIYAADTYEDFQYTDGTYATITSQNPHNSLAYYGDWGTPGTSSGTPNMSKIYIYGFKPSQPLFITGINIPVANWSDKGDFNLTCKIVKATRDASTGKCEIGDVIAQCDATIDNVDDTYAGTTGLTTIDFNNFYTTDKDSMTEEIDHLFLDEEFAIVLDGWNNGTFTAVLGSEESYDALAPISTWFEKDGEEGYMYRYPTWRTKLLVGYDGAVYGYLHTTDDTDLKLAQEGETKSIHIEPMYANNAEEGESQTMLYVEGEIPEWITLEPANEIYTDDEWSYDLNVTAEENTSGGARSATIRVYQPGAYIDITVSQPFKGDVNSDGKVDVADVTAILSVMYGTETKYADTADVNGDGAVDISDVTATLTILYAK